MAAGPLPQTPLYRYTLFFGPEPVETANHILHCVFNVKKRSWKGGVQVSVQIEQAQVERVAEHLHFESWLEQAIKPVPEEERPDYQSLGHDRFVQYLCQLKLQFALNTGLRPETTTLDSSLFQEELEETIQEFPKYIKQHVLTELDLLDEPVE